MNVSNEIKWVERESHREILLCGRIYAIKGAMSFHSTCLLRFARDIVVKKHTCSFVTFSEMMLK